MGCLQYLHIYSKEEIPWNFFDDNNDACAIFAVLYTDSGWNVSKVSMDFWHVASHWNDASLFLFLL